MCAFRKETILKSQKGNVALSLLFAAATVGIGYCAGRLHGDMETNKELKNSVIIQLSDDQEALRRSGAICPQAMTDVFRQVLEEKDRLNAPLARMNMTGQTPAMLAYCKGIKQ